MSKTNFDKLYTDDELKVILHQMRQASSDLYRAATASGCHPFIEFCGIINEWIKMCEVTMEQGEDFTMANTHTGQPLRAEPYQIKYFAEKFDCIFGPIFKDKTNRELFMKEMGWFNE